VLENLISSIIEHPNINRIKIVSLMLLNLLNFDQMVSLQDANFNNKDCFNQE